MRKKLFTGLSEQERIDNLDAECQDTDPAYSYFKTFDKEEREALEQSYIENTKKLQGLQQIIKPLKKEMSLQCLDLHIGGRSVTERVWIMRDFDKQEVGVYNNRGELVEARPFSAADRQLTIND